MNGYGKITYANLDTYEGYWKENLFHGKGKYYRKKTDQMFEGTWRNGKLIERLDEYDKCTIFIFSIQSQVF